MEYYGEDEHQLLHATKKKLQLVAGKKYIIGETFRNNLCFCKKNLSVANYIVSDYGRLDENSPHNGY